MLERSKDAASLSHFRPEPVKRPHWRQEGPHPHQVILGPENDGEVIVPDLGSDKVFGLRKTPGTSPWEVQRTFEGFEPGDGPRHSVIHPDSRSSGRLQLMARDPSVYSLRAFVYIGYTRPFRSFNSNLPHPYHPSEGPAERCKHARRRNCTSPIPLGR